MIKKVTLIFPYKFLLLALFISQSSQARNYCFSKTVNLSEVRKDLSVILIGESSISSGNGPNCLYVRASGTQGMIVDKFLHKNYWIVSKDRNDSISANIQQCIIEVETKSKKESNSRLFDLKGRRIKAKDNFDHSKGSSISSLVVSSGRRGTLSLDGNEIQVSCIARGNSFDLDFYLQKSPGNFVSSSITVQKNQKVNIGGVVKDLEAKGRKLSIKPSVDLNKNSGKKRMDYFISVR